MNEQLAPAGLHDAVVFDVQDLGEMRTPWGYTHKVQLCFSIWAQQRFFYVPRAYAFKLVARSHLVRDLEALLGHAPPPDFDLSKLIKLPCQLHLSTETLAGGRVRNRVLGILPARPEQDGQSPSPSPRRRWVPVPIVQPLKKGGSLL